MAFEKTICMNNETKAHLKVQNSNPNSYLLKCKMIRPFYIPPHSNQ